MPNSTVLSSSKPSQKARGQGRPTSKPAAAGSDSAPKRRGGRKAGALKWSTTEYLTLFEVIAERRPSGNYDWKGVGEEHSRAGTARSGDTCKSHWTQVLKLPKPTGRSKLHPLHRLALAIDEHISRVNSTITLNDDDNDDPYGELKYEFQLAKDHMKRLKLDFTRPPNFNIPLPDEDAELDEGSDGSDQGGNSEDSDQELGNEEEDEQDDAPNNQDDAVALEEDNQVAAKGTRHASEAPTELDKPEDIGTGANKTDQEFRRSLSWDLEPSESAMVPLPAPEAPVHVSQKTQAELPELLQGDQHPPTLASKSKSTPAPFPMSKPSPVKPAHHVNTIKTEAGPTKPTEKPSAGVAPRKRPVPKPQRPITPEPMGTSSSPRKREGTGLGSVASIEVVAKPSKSNKRKADDQDDQEAKRKASKRAGASVSNKASGSKGKERMQDVVKVEDEGVIDLTSDGDENGVVGNYFNKKQQSDVATVTIMDHLRKIQRLETNLNEANKEIAKLRMEVLELKQEKQIEVRVQEELAKRAKEEQSVPVPVVPRPVALAPAIGHIEDAFDPSHPFNQPLPDGGAMFGH